MEKVEKFSEIELKIFHAVCEAARELTKNLLEDLDEYLMQQRDRKRYRNKQTRETSVKTLYGAVEYKRRMYYDKKKKCMVYLLDEKLEMEKCGQVSANMARVIADAAADMPYRKTADLITKTTGLSISSHGAWDIVQKIGKVINEKEEAEEAAMEADEANGEIKSNIIFMEADGVYLKMQKNHKKAKSQEMKVATIYTGWNKSCLANKRVLAGMATAKEFHRKMEAMIQNNYDMKNRPARALNADGAEWISNTYNPERIFQLDNFHIQKKIRESIRHKETANRISENIKAEHYSEALQDIRMYIDSIEDKKSVKKAEDLYKYLSNNLDGLPRWQKQVAEKGIILQPPEGIEYKNMGVQEGQNCNLITIRMKGRKMRWSDAGADNLAKIIYTRENGELDEVIEKYDGKVYLPEEYELELKTISAAKIKKIVGEGNRWAEAIRVTMPALGSATGNYTDALRQISLGGQI